MSGTSVLDTNHVYQVLSQSINQCSQTTPNGGLPLKKIPWKFSPKFMSEPPHPRFHITVYIFFMLGVPMPFPGTPSFQLWECWNQKLWKSIASQTVTKTDQPPNNPANYSVTPVYPVQSLFQVYNKYKTSLMNGETMRNKTGILLPNLDEKLPKQDKRMQISPVVSKVNLSY